MRPSATVHQAAAKDIDFRIRAARGSVWNGLLCPDVRCTTQIGATMPFMNNIPHEEGAVKVDRTTWESRLILEVAGLDRVNV